MGVKAWDVAAGALLVREAGGIVRDFTDEGLNPSRPAHHGRQCRDRRELPEHPAQRLTGIPARKSPIPSDAAVVYGW
jgi:hypothetical protein